MTTVPFSEAKSHLSDLADRVESEREQVVVTRHGRPAFVLVHPDYLDALEETLEILGDDELMASLARSRRQADDGLATPFDRPGDD
jgi:prevent-host-death family protein